jgi:NAD(P)-dependent dehydrogenase (short-subunit alcohol dehydrogenase family)
MKVIRGKRALVTGAASGIGRAIALALAEEGADLFLLDVDEAKLIETARTARQMGGQVRTHVCDLAQSADIQAALDALLAAWGGLDILINNAGIAYYGATEAMADGLWDRILAVNLLAPIRLARELLPVLAAQEEAHIVNVCSFLGLAPARKITAYQTSKFGLVGFSLALRTEYGRPNFGVTTLCPGFVRTAMTANDDAAPTERARRSFPYWLMTSADVVAARTIAAIRRNRGLVVITPFARFWWWLTRLSPPLADWVLREGWRRKGRLKIGPR